jgi:hypothetical protein
LIRAGKERDALVRRESFNFVNIVPIKNMAKISKPAGDSAIKKAVIYARVSSKEQEKAEQGIWPTVTPLGYRNLLGPDGKKIIEPDPETGPLIARLFEWYAAGTLSLREAARKVRAAGLVRRKSGAPVPVSTVPAQSALRRRIRVERSLLPGTHQPLVSPELWERVQGVLDGRQANKHRRNKHNFAFSGLIACGHCGCSIVGEIKKQRYIYYHCTGYKGRCDEPYVREEILERHFSDLLGRLSFGRRRARVGAGGAAWVMRTRSASMKGHRNASDRSQASAKPAGRDVHRQAGREGRRYVLRADVDVLAGGAGRLPPRDRAALGCE